MLSSVGLKGTSIAVDSDGHPHISYYYDSSTDYIKHAQWNGASWDTENIDQINGPVSPGSMLTGIAVDTANNPHISYCDLTDWDLKYAKWNGTTWDIATVESTGDVGAHSSIVLDPSDNPHIVYFPWVGGFLQYALQDSGKSAGAKADMIASATRHVIEHEMAKDPK